MKIFTPTEFTLLTKHLIRPISLILFFEVSFFLFLKLFLKVLFLGGEGNERKREKLKEGFSFILRKK